MGEAYLKAGKKQLAAQHYRRSLQLNPENKNAKAILAELN
jgi:cytochrome c-type biogenesis protein CcmH/NrfG